MIERSLLVDYLDKGMTQRQIAEKCGVCQTTARHWITRYGLPNPSSKLRRLSDEQLQYLVQTSISFCDICRKSGFATTGSIITRLKERTIKLGLSTAHFKTGYEVRRLNFELRPIATELFVVSSPSDYTRTSRVKAELLKLVSNQCQKCGCKGEWHGEPLTLQMDHVNGLRWDNRLENLQILCPNCHSQTPTYGSKNRK